MLELDSFWAKTNPFQSIVTHALVSGTIAQCLLTEYLAEGNRQQLCVALGLNPDELSRFVGYLVSLHDVGKLDYSFQSSDEDMHTNLAADPVLRESYRQGVRHEKTGKRYIRSLWKDWEGDRDSYRVFADIIGAHHQGKSGADSFLKGSPWNAVRDSLVERMLQYFRGNCRKDLPQIGKDQNGKTAVFLLGLMILADWIASGPGFADSEDWIKEPDGDTLLKEKVHAFLQKSGLQPYDFTWPKNFCGVWTMIPQAGRRPLQKDLDELLEKTEKPLSLVLLEAPMGEGKTEAGMFAALQMARTWGKDGFYVALPTAATANQMVARMQTLMESHKLHAAVRLLHSMAWLTESEEVIHSPDERDEASRWLAPLRRGLLGQFAVGTVDQAMLAATNVKYGVLRLLGLSNKVLIIDEIHSYDAYMGEIIVRLLEWCRALEIPVVMLSATLPIHLKQKLLKPYTDRDLSEAYPLITTIDSRGELREQIISGTTHRLRASLRMLPVLGDPVLIAETAVNEAFGGGCICVLMNTVPEAQTVYRAIRERYSGDLLLFHAQFPAEQRAELERACITRYGKDKSCRPERSILVATQVVEQSLDVDFDAMLTAVAPIDLLIQRLGRVFRHADTPRPVDRSAAGFTVLIPKAGGGLGPSAAVYPECFLNSAIRVLSSRDSIAVPEDLAELVREGYDPSLVPEGEVTAWNENRIKEALEAGASLNYLLNPPDKSFSGLQSELLYDDDEDAFSLSVKTRLGEPTVRLALLSEAEMKALTPFLRDMNGKRYAAVRSRAVAEQVMKRCLTVRVGRLGGLSGLSDIRGDMLLSGVRILPLNNGSCSLPNGKTLRLDRELGLLIEDGE